jgi:hypothetical protein
MSKTQIKSWSTCPACDDGPVFLYKDGLCGHCTAVTPQEHHSPEQGYTRRDKKKAPSYPSPTKGRTNG